MQLMRGRGFGVDYTDREWRKPYEQHNANGEFNALLAHREGFQPNTFRPPLLPVVVAIVYRIFGRDFLIWRIVESLFTAAALALICNVAWREFGPHASMITFLLLLLSGTYTPFVAYQWLLTEPLAIAMTACMVWTLSTVKGSHRTAMALLCGVFFALLCLTRSFYVVWLPALAVIVWWMGRRRAAAVFVAAAVLVQLPWWIRNCRVTDSFMPGANGTFEMLTRRDSNSRNETAGALMSASGNQRSVRCAIVENSTAFAAARGTYTYTNGRMGSSAVIATRSAGRRSKSHDVMPSQ